MRIYSALSRNLGYLLALTFFFMLIEMAFFIVCNESYLYVFSFVSDRIHLPLAIMPGILFFVFSQLLIHFFYCLLMGVIAAIFIEALNINIEKQLIFSISVWLAGMMTVLVANCYFYPNSHFSQLCTVFFGYDGAGYALSVLLVGWVGGFSWIMVGWIRRVLSVVIHQYLPHLIFALVLVTLLSLSSLIFSRDHFTSTATSSKPNIIIIGIDSLRPDQLSYFGGEAHTPFISKFLEQAAVFNEAVTPLARTYPSWVGILSGRYPIQTGVRTNLSGLANVNVNDTLPSLLRQQGYEAVYATDETRFSNIDTQFGFDRTITPPVGINDFLLGSFNDFPLSNLVVNTPIGRWLFPYSYANRPAYVTYHPNSFLKLLRPALLRDHTQPLFLAVHFCLPHHPYLYDRMVGDALTGQERYQQSIERADKQIRDFFALLRQSGLLDHAVVVLLSDHGEALELPGDRLTERDAYLPERHKAPIFYPPSEDNKLAMNQTAGHGTDVLGLSQYHSLLAFRLYGAGKQTKGVISGAVSLLDIKQTVMALVSGNRFTHTSGVSLASLIKSDTKQSAQNRMLFLESDYSPAALRTVYPETSKLLMDGVDLFEIDPITMRLTTKKQMVEMIIKSKQYAVIYGHWMLALYPQPDHTKMPVLINLNSGNWTNDLHSSFALASPANAMHLALEHFYGREVQSGAPNSNQLRT
jgi:arylsulfatase A-like enzyme